MQTVVRPDATIAYLDEGARDAPPILLLMGLGGTYASWGDTFLQALHPRHRLIRVENRGVGASVNAKERFSMADMAADAAAVLDAAGLSSAHVAGISMGGMIAQQLALDAPHRVRSLGLISTHFGGREVVPMTERAQVLFQPRPEGQSEQQYQERLFTQLTAPGFGEANLDEVQRFIAARIEYPLSMATYHAQLHALLESDRSAAVATLSAPTVVIHGADDPLIPVDNGRMLAERVPDARYVELDDCGHMPPWEHPLAVAQALGSIVESAQ